MSAEDASLLAKFDRVAIVLELRAEVAALEDQRNTAYARGREACTIAATLPSGSLDERDLKRLNEIYDQLAAPPVDPSPMTLPMPTPIEAELTRQVTQLTAERDESRRYGAFMWGQFKGVQAELRDARKLGIGLTDDNIENCLNIAAKASVSPTLSIRGDGSIVQSGLGRDLTDRDAELFEHARNWVMELASALRAARNELARIGERKCGDCGCDLSCNSDECA